MCFPLLNINLYNNNMEISVIQLMNNSQLLLVFPSYALELLNENFNPFDLYHNQIKYY